MKIRTNSGEVTLTAEMVCKGMVFQAPNHEPYTLLHQIVESGDWVGSDGMGERAEYLLDEEVRTFLGCNPEVATRADCERFGVYGDAAAHGFARLRDRGALDLWREAPVGTVYEFDGRRFTVATAHVWASYGHVSLEEGARFIGLDADHAHPEDVRRLCCLAPQNGDVGSAVRCTLAIGEHEQHEDIARGVKWSAEKGERKAPRK